MDFILIVKELVSQLASLSGQFKVAMNSIPIVMTYSVYCGSECWSKREHTNNAWS